MCSIKNFYRFFRKQKDYELLINQIPTGVEPMYNVNLSIHKLNIDNYFNYIIINYLLVMLINVNQLKMQ